LHGGQLTPCTSAQPKGDLFLLKSQVGGRRRLKDVMSRMLPDGKMNDSTRTTHVAAAAMLLQAMVANFSL